MKPTLNCFNCEMERGCGTFLDRINQKKIYSTDIKVLKRKPANEYYQMLPYYIGEFETKLNIIDFDSATEILLTAEKPLIQKRRFERKYSMIICKSYKKNEDIPESKEIIVYGFKHNRTDKIDKYILIGLKSDESYENDKLFNFWTNKFISQVI